MILYRKVHEPLVSTTITLEWVPQDLWIGLYYKAQEFTKFKHLSRWRPWKATFLDVYICVIPTIVIHCKRLR